MHFEEPMRDAELGLIVAEPAMSCSKANRR